jgi:hypothetical protein
MNYQVGQVLYTCNEKSLKIIPLQIVEIVVRTTINGEKKEYIVQLPDKENTTTSLESIGGNIFSDIDTIRTHLIDNATSAIDKMINLANSIVTERFINVNNIVQNNTSMQVDTNNDIIMVDLGNGVKAKMNTTNLEKVANQ